MKKNFKKVIAAILCVVMAMGLGGCVTMGELKASHAYFKADTTGVIIYDDVEYLVLPKYENFSPNLDNNMNIYITQEDEPMLLREYLGNYIDISQDRNFLICSYECTSTPNAYCRADVYGEMVKQLSQDHPLNRYCYSYNEWDDTFTTLSTHYYNFSDAEIEFMTTLMSEANTLVIMREDFDITSYDALALVYSCSEDMMFKKEAYSVYKSYDGNYFLRGTSSSSPVYPVPAQSVAEFKKVFDPIINANLIY